MKKGRYNNTWFINETFRSTITVPATPGDRLAATVRTHIDNKVVNGGKTRIIQTSGLPVHAQLRKENPYTGEECPYIDKCCAKQGTDCSSTNITYKLKCSLCEQQGETTTRPWYLGCTGKSLHSRTLDHIKDVKSGDTANSMAKHMAIVHPGARRTTEFGAEVLAKHNSCLKRFVDESLHIESNKESACNSKSEWGGGALVRMVPTGGRNEDRNRTNRQNRLSLTQNDPG